MIKRRQVIAQLVAITAMASQNTSLAQEKAAAMLLSNPRYSKNPMAFFFESYVLDVIGHLPPARSEAIQSMNLQNVFKTEAREWRAVVRETLHLSNTVNVAILDLWYTNQDLAAQRKVEYTPLAFAQDFTDEYQKDGSIVDVWPAGALAAAQARIAARRRTTPQQ
jgi:hypothetical protein